jgi:cytochrome P450
LKSQEHAVASAYRYLFKPNLGTRFAVLLGYLFPPFQMLPIRANLEIKKARKVIQDTALHMIHVKQAQGNDKEGRGERDILGVILEENRTNLENGTPADALNEYEMVNQIMTFLAAGY